THATVNQCGKGDALQIWSKNSRILRCRQPVGTVVAQTHCGYHWKVGTRRVASPCRRQLEVLETNESVSRLSGGISRIYKCFDARQSRDGTVRTGSEQEGGIENG